MKTSFHFIYSIFLICFFGNYAFSQTNIFPFNNDNIEYSEIIETKLATEELSQKSEMVLQRLVSGPKDKFISTSNKNYGISGSRHGKIRVETGLFSTCYAKEYKYKYNVSILFKEGKWKYNINDIFLYYETASEYSGSSSTFYGITFTGGQIKSGEEISMKLEDVLKNIDNCQSVWNKVLTIIDEEIKNDISFLKNEIAKNDGW